MITLAQINAWAERWLPWLSCPALMAVVLVCQRDVIGLPYHWDEVVAYYHPLSNMLERGVWRILLEPDIFLFHPPGMQLMAWPLYLVFGDVPATGRVFSAMMTALGLHFTILLGRRMHGWWFGILAALLTFSGLRVYPNALQFHADNTLFGLGMAFLYLGLTGRFGWAIAAGLLAGFVRESALAFGFVLGAYYLFFLRPWPRIPWKPALAAAAPFISLALTFLFHKWITGNFVNHRAVLDSHIRFTGIDFLGNLEGVMSRLTYGNFIILKGNGPGLWEANLLLATLILFFLSWLPQRLIGARASGWRMHLGIGLVLLSLLGIFTVFFSFNSGFLDRYLLPVFPCLALFVLGQLWALFPRGAALLAVAAIGTNHWSYYHAHYPDRPGRFAYEATMDFKNMIRMHQKMALYLDDNLPEGAKILTRWPFNNIFLHPRYGYVKKLRIDVLDEVAYPGIAKLEHAEYMLDGMGLPAGEATQLDPYRPRFELLKEFREPGMWVALYRRVGKGPLPVIAPR